ncbi:MAG: FecR domain-containing protein [Saprospiraceae bacterium]|nr:FecR domain-containing protein [Saprospiraceae bacterium]
MDKYIQYDHLELSEDPSFIRWTKGSKSEDNNDWDRWLKEHPEKKAEVLQAQSIVKAMKFVVEEPKQELEDKLWNAISSEIQSTQSPSETKSVGRTRILKLLTYGAVAAVLLFVLFQNIGNEFDTTVHVPYAKVENITLPDGSEVTINADSKLEYDVHSWEENRLVSLEGEAFFSVKKGSKFTVKTNHGSVQVLGTSFNVFDRKQIFEVHCETGKVAVKSAGTESILTPNQSVSVIQKQHVFNDRVPESEKRSTWKTGVYVYKSTPLIDVIAELERQLDIKVTIDKSLNSTKYTGSFNKSDINKALMEVCYPLNLKFEVDGKKVDISK